MARRRTSLLSRANFVRSNLKTIEQNKTPHGEGAIGSRGQLGSYRTGIGSRVQKLTGSAALPFGKHSFCESCKPSRFSEDDENG
jgi:hypothetical protein